jgi:malonyl-CoA O-methyltransferase
MSGALRDAFERAATTYDAHGVLQREVGRRLLEHLDGIRIDPAVVLDLGCATGAGYEGLLRRFPRADIVGLDIAMTMLRTAAARTPWWKRLLRRQVPPLVCGDAQRLPLAAASVQLIFSNLMLQWCDAEAVFAEAARVLPQGGLFMFSTFGPDTLKELRAAFAAVGAGDRINTFVDMHDLGDALVHAGFADPVMEMEMVTLEYSTVDALVNDLRHVGSHARLASAAPLGRTRWPAMAAAYEKTRRAGALPASYEVIYGHAWKVPPRKIADGRQVIGFQGRR